MRAGARRHQHVRQRRVGAETFNQPSGRTLTPARPMIWTGGIDCTTCRRRRNGRLNKGTEYSMTEWRTSEADVAAILAARHPDPFAILGPHETPAGLVIRALVPGATSLAVLDWTGTSLATLENRSQDGFFEGLLPDRPARFPYRLRAENEDGAWTLRDQYAFPPVLGSLDDHLLVEGTHRRLYERLGAHPMCHDGTDGTHFAVWAPNA